MRRHLRGCRRLTFGASRRCLTPARRRSKTARPRPSAAYRSLTSSARAESLDAGCLLVSIVPRGLTASTSTIASDALARLNTTRSFGGRDIRFAGKGSKTFITMHNTPASEAIYTQQAGVTTPTFIALAHELIHALHHLGGNTYDDKVSENGREAKREEMFTTGLGVYAETRISENAIRRQFNLPVRTFYTFQDGHLLIKSLERTIDTGLPKGYCFCSAMQQMAG